MPSKLGAAGQQVEEGPVETVVDPAAHHVAGEIGRRGDERRGEAVAVGEVQPAEIVVDVVEGDRPRPPRIFAAETERPAETGPRLVAERAGAGNEAWDAEQS